MKQKNFIKKENVFLITFLFIIIISVLGISLDLMAPDAALYGTISKTIYENNDFVNLYVLGKDWLDKPHLPFWITAVSFKIFGVSNFAYKIPAILIFFYGVFLTFKFTKAHYNYQTAILASFILLTSTHSVISNFDVRAEPYLTTFIIGSIYYLDKYLKEKNILVLLIACVFCAFSIMTKGIFTLIPIIAALGGELLVKRKWKEVLNPIWIVAFITILILILPELYTLYVQFDMHPEKIVFGQKNVSGIKFFFWDSQFGRFFNSSYIKGSGDTFYYLHTLLWAFLPWGIFFYISTFLKIKRNFKKIIKTEEFYTIFGSLTMLIVFSLSKFQLAHYTNILFPFMSIIVADFIYKVATQYKNLKKLYIAIHWFQNSLTFLIIVCLFFVLKPIFNPLSLLVIILFLYIAWITYKSSKEDSQKLFIYSATFFLMVYGILFTQFYPTILKYQSGVLAAKIVNEKYDGKAAVLNSKGETHYGLEFYLEKPIQRVNSLTSVDSKEYVFFLNDKEYKSLIKQNINFEVLNIFEHFPITRLNLEFLNSVTRKNACSNKYLIKIIS